ncbi:MAG: protein sphX [Candidatus Dactylopiibacterium carminicum]|uniref:Phosphate-binding protein n=1 Tax=Candidatus Dactylopiibacterium carminicum TaxID=857335 RepID=A0A272EPY0_9RHOO|nr:PstS family phosphate ABC transporter substrate-binding protein [Candidatus Dactylopiibacterium carminicum]KAF7598433.1 protein sphX [Candidatus Dactylopiibacterium carminicum]PAS92174.1 MAG: protein sphX [Candidatus Dactylopiibacterium carminicum]PAS95675.1 MAG: protein sphX [Candidatus Dactylopiibacterium carminicum]PAS97667.1 MAG: protein sphX [Candidatus Dactylopiibacterium carminicum]
MIFPRMAFLLCVCAMGLASAGVRAQSVVRVDGSSTVFPISEAAAEDFQIARREKRLRVTVGMSGTGGGFKKFCMADASLRVDVTGASRPISTGEMAACRAAGIRFIELPIAFDAVTIVVSKRNPLESISIEDLKKIWEPAAQAKIFNWRQVNPAFPDRALKLYGPGTDSGTFEYFTEAAVGRVKASRGDYTASEDDNVVVQGVSRDNSGLGYLGYAYYAENTDKLKALAISPAVGKPAVLPSEQSVMDGSYVPMSRPIFIYVNAEAAGKRPEVRDFVEFYLKHAGAFAREVKYVPLRDVDYAQVLENFGRLRTGTAFEGHSEIGVKVAELLKREVKE